MNDDQPKSDPPSLLDQPLAVINVGLERFADDIAAQDGKVLHIAWTPPAGGDETLASMLADLGC